MFDSLKVPTIGVVENMAYYMAAPGDKRRIFGPGYTQQLINQFGIKNSFEVPIMEEISQMSDAGSPFVLTLPDEMPIVKMYTDLAEKVNDEVKQIEQGGNEFARLEAKYDPVQSKVIIEEKVGDDGSESASQQ